MTAPPKVFESAYRNDRRKHRHRCRWCNKTMKDGAPALWYRHNKGTWTVHVDCADIPNIDGVTMRQLFQSWAGAD